MAPMTAVGPGPLAIDHFSDILCVWAYVAQVRVDELRRRFADQLVIRSRFCSVFADVATKVHAGWRDRGGLAGYRAHLEQTLSRFDHVTLHADTWAVAVPTTSATVHACVKAAELVRPDAVSPDGTGRSLADELAWQLRLAFFRDGRDVSRLDVQLAIVEQLGLPVDAVRARLEDGSAWATLHRDYEDAAKEGVRGSPTFLLNEHRQVLYGNVGYKIIEANVLELLRDRGPQASWC